jgi:hypothetical protein
MCAMVDTLERLGIGLCSSSARDAPQRAGHRRGGRAARRADRGRGHPEDHRQRHRVHPAVVRIRTAVVESGRSSARRAAKPSARNGIGLVKLMGRHSGFIAAAAIANSDVNVCLVPEVLHARGLLAALEASSRNADVVVVVGEGRQTCSGDRPATRRATSVSPTSALSCAIASRITSRAASTPPPSRPELPDPSARRTRATRLLPDARTNAVHAGGGGGRAW